jgi:elongation factor 1-alpha
MATDDKQHLSIVICGHVDSGKSTTTGRLLFELGGIPERELEKLKEEAANLGKSSFAFAFYMDRQKEERERGVTIACTTKEFFTDKWHYTIIDAPGHRDFIKNMISGAAQADVALLMVPADGNFTTAIQKGDAKAGEIQGQTRQHARILNLLGVKQLVIGVNKMDSDVAKYSEERYNEIRDEMRSMLIRVGWKKDFVANSVPVLPISGWMGDNLLEKSTNMGWWAGQKIKVDSTGEEMLITTVKQCLNDMAQPPKRETDKPMRCPISGIYKIKGVGDVLAGRVEQGLVNPGEDVIFMPTHTTGTPCEGKVFTVEMHHKRVDAAKPGDNVGMNIKGLDKNNMPRSGDVMVYTKDGTLKGTKSFACQIQTLDNIPGELKCGYSPIGFVRCGRAACRMTEITWKMGKETGGQKLESPPHLKANEVAQATFEPMTPLVCDSFKNCEGLSRIAFLDGNTVMMLGKVVSTVAREEGAAKKK